MNYDARSVIVDLTPPALLRAAQKVWRRARGLGFHTWEGSYPSLADVPCDEDSYDDDEIAQLVVASTVRHLESAGATKKIIDGTGHLILPVIVAQFLNERLTVLDFGGGPAVGLFSILDHVPALDLAKFSYVLVETRAVCRAFRTTIEPALMNKLGRSCSVEVAEAIPASLGGPLIVNAAGVIHYISDYRDALSKLASLAPEFFIVSQTPMTDGPTYARQQLNTPHKKLAAWVFNRADFLSEMKRLGYRSIFAVDHDLPLTHKNAPGPSSVVSMVFRPYRQNPSS